jgi:hypothetical protein
VTQAWSGLEREADTTLAILSIFKQSHLRCGEPRVIMTSLHSLQLMAVPVPLSQLYLPNGGGPAVPCGVILLKVVTEMGRPAALPFGIMREGDTHANQRIDNTRGTEVRAVRERGLRRCRGTSLPHNVIGNVLVNSGYVKLSLSDTHLRYSLTPRDIQNVVRRMQRNSIRGTQ